MKDSIYTTKTRPYLVNDFCLKAEELAEKEVRIRTRRYGFLSSFDKELLRDMIVEKVWTYFDTYDPSIAKLDTLVSRIAHNATCDYIARYMRREGRTSSLDRILGWTADDERDADSHPVSSVICQDAIDIYGESEVVGEREMEDWATETRNTLGRKLSEGDVHVIGMLEEGLDRDSIAEVLGCTRNAADKRVHDTRERARKALGCRAARSRKARREISETSVDLPALVFYSSVKSEKLVIPNGSLYSSSQRKPCVNHHLEA